MRKILLPVLLAIGVGISGCSGEKKVKNTVNISDVKKAVSSSQDIGKYATLFASTAKSLIENNRCTLKEFNDMGGWWKSTTHKGSYFIYCGGQKVHNKIYLNVHTGETHL